MKKRVKFYCIFCSLFFAMNASAQVKIEDLPFDLGKLLGQKDLLTVKKGFSPVFHLGKFQINKVGILGEKLKGVEVLGDIFSSKNVDKVKKLYKTYKTGLVVFKILAASGTAVAAYSTVRGFVNENKFNNKTVQAMLYPALTSMLTSVITKVITKKASYKAVDIFNGVVKDKIKDIFSVAPASSTIGLGLYVKL